MNRLLYALPIAALALLPAAAGATPSPSPGLDQIIAAPPTDFVAVTTSSFNGKFTAHDYAATGPASKATAVENTLNHEGFVDGYGLTWVQRTTGHVLVEAVIAFQGGRGARTWLTAAEAADKSDSTYQHADTMSGIDPYYGGHFLYTQNNVVGDVFSFVKGNDVFIVGAVSAKDDVLSLAMAQTRGQYDAAPAATIPSDQ